MYFYLRFFNNAVNSYIAVGCANRQNYGFKFEFQSAFKEPQREGDVAGIRRSTPEPGSDVRVSGIHIISGFIRDVSNSYALSMWVLAGMLLTSFTLWLFMPAAVRYDQRRSEEKEGEEQQQDPKKVW